MPTQPPSAGDQPAASEAETSAPARPGDGAREALRAARRQARQARETASARRPGSGRRPVRSPSAADARARTVRDLLAHAFRPPYQEEPSEDAAAPAAPRPLSEDAAAPAALRPLSEDAAASAAPSSPAAGSDSTGTPPHRPSDAPAGNPTTTPTHLPDTNPPHRPSNTPAGNPTVTPSHLPDNNPPQRPSDAPAGNPTVTPSHLPDNNPPQRPSNTPAGNPTVTPTHLPDNNPPQRPSDAPADGRTDTPPHKPAATTPTASTNPPPPTGAPDDDAPALEAAPPRTPPSMAAPRRDGELRRTFPAFPPGPSAGPGFAGTWWGNAWVTALEEGALDAGRLARGRTYAERGHVDAITVTPGLVLAYVQGSRPRPYRVQVRLRTLDDTDWDRFLDTAAERPGHIAALLDKELPPSLADCGVRLLPGPGDLAPRCNCPDSGHPCKHAAALCYQMARLLDADPFVLLLLRGRGERELLDALSRLSAARAARAAQGEEPAAFPGVRATEALTPRALPPLPPPLPAPPHPEQPPAYPAAPGGPDPFALDQLATDAAARAHALLTTGRDPVGGLTLWQDAVRLAAARPGSGLTAGTRALYSSLARAAGRDTAELARAVAAWRQGGAEGLSVLEEPWDPPAGRFDRARPLLLAADLPAFRPWRNRLTHPGGHIQLRLGRDGLWYAYESEPDRDDWWPRGTPDLDPVGALTGLGAADGN
ncbi:SWIM zinc finger family protein [Streptomyces niveoruber]|uniref:SWIM zinc finger family protein n=1 Tax=Streptomyces griseoviridis TaxID=45398 RepID=UPI0016788F58